MSEMSYRRLLKSAYLERREKNRTYSLRAFARQLGLSPAFVSYVFQEKRHLSPQLAVKVAKKLNWNEQEQKYFLSLIELENPKTNLSQEVAIEQIRKFNSSKMSFTSVEAEAFAAMSVWYHNAILILLTVKNKKHTIQSIAQRLKLDRLDTEAALHRLKNLGLVRVDGDEWSSTHNMMAVNSVPSSAIRSYHKQMLKKAGDALEKQSFEEREFSNLTITVNPNHLELAKKKIREFTNEMAQLLDGSNATEVYQLSVQLFRLSQPQS